MSKEAQQPDWGRIAEKFDLWLPYIAPVGKAMLEVLPVAPGDKVLDVACGTGEPALSIARNNPKAEITAIDAAPPMMEVARRKAAEEILENITFEAMPAEAIRFEDTSFDKLCCRFGVMLFEDSQQGLNEMCRVLKPGGRFVLAVWGTPETMTTMDWARRAFAGRIPEEDYPAVEKISSLGEPGRLEAMLEKAGFDEFTVTRRTFHYRFPSFGAYWDLVEVSDILKQQFDALPEGERSAVRDDVAAFAREFHGKEGLAIPHDYLLANGLRR
ncbi:MAG TPA: class I SAM-dependent methyltransferase [Mariprofundaceae bacterium]|nr:class I SAM-dependent methyltransferase [Mariprofundaceae bacterium]